MELELLESSFVVECIFEDVDVRKRGRKLDVVSQFSHSPYTRNDKTAASLLHYMLCVHTTHAKPEQ
jgi:hypothetical protein